MEEQQNIDPTEVVARCSHCDTEVLMHDVQRLFVELHTSVPCPALALQTLICMTGLLAEKFGIPGIFVLERLAEQMGVEAALMRVEVPDTKWGVLS